MINNMFKEVFDLSKQLQEKNYRKDYKNLSKIDKNIGTFEEYVENEKKGIDREIPSEKKKIIEDAYIAKDELKKENIKFNLYLFHHTRIDPIEFDENYKPLPLKEKEVYEYGSVVSLEDESGYYNISGVFGGTEDSKELAKEKYNSLKIKIENLSEEQLLDSIKDEILMQINE